MPQKILKKISENILPAWKVCFVSAVVVGLLAHLYKITNWLPNWDSLVFRYDSQNMIALGRWFLPVVCSFSSFYDLPFLNGIVSIVLHALSAVCICKILNVYRKITAFLIGAIIVSFPTVTSVMMYNYVADGYSFAFLLSTIAALLMTQAKPRYILAAVISALSMGIYQAYITVTIMLVLLKLIDETIYYNKGFSVILKKSILMLSSGVAAVVIYAVVLKVLLAISSVELLEYQGINNAASLSSIDLLGSIYVIKETFIKCFFDLSAGINAYVILNSIVALLTVVHYIKYIIENKIYKKPVNVFMLLVLSVMLVVGAGALAFVNSGIDYHNLMLMGYSIFYMFFIILYERGADKTSTLDGIKCWIIILTAAAIVSNQVVIANVSYHKAQMAYEKSYGVLIRIADRIEQTPEAEDCDKILVIGALENSEEYSVNLTPNITGITNGYIIRADDETVNQSVLCSALGDYCEKDYEFISGAEKEKFMQQEDVASMKNWPSKDCLKVIDDTIIIKLGTEGED